MNCDNLNDGINFILSASAIAVILAKNLKPDEQDLLGSFLQCVGQNLTSISALCIEQDIFLPGNSKI